MFAVLVFCGMVGPDEWDECAEKHSWIYCYRTLTKTTIHPENSLAAK
jgi:hypothetical protein